MPYAQKRATTAMLNAASMNMNIVKNVQKPVSNVQKNAERCNSLNTFIACVCLCNIDNAIKFA